MSAAELEAAFARCERRLGAYLVALVSDRELAKDLLQDTFHDALRSERRAPEVRDREAWLFGIARNRALSALRRRRRGEAALRRLHSGGVRQREEGELVAVHDLLERHLTPEERALVVLRYEHGFDAGELAELTGLSAVAIRQRLSRARAKLVAAVVATAALVLGGIALAGDTSPLAGIAAVSHAREPSDVLDPATAAMLQNDLPPGGGGDVDQIGSRLLDGSRLLGMLPSGLRVYAVPSSKGRLCIALEGEAESCSDALTPQSPITETIDDRDGPGGEGAIAYGAALDGVVSVSFPVGGVPVDVPVRKNFWFWQQPHGSYARGFAPVLVRWADGSVTAAR